MTNPRSRVFAAVAGMFSLSAAAWAADTTPVQTPQDAKIRELEAKVAALEQKQTSASDATSPSGAVLTTVRPGSGRCSCRASACDA